MELRNIVFLYMKNNPSLKMFYLSCSGSMVRTLAFSVTFNNISVISWLSVLLVEETGVPEENNRLAANH